MEGSRSAGNAREQLGNIYVVHRKVLDRSCDFAVVHSWHSVPNTVQEVGDATAILLEGPMHGRPDPATFLDNRQFRSIAEFAAKREVPLAFIDVQMTVGDVLRVGAEQAVAIGGLVGGGYLAYRSVSNASRGVSRRAFLQGVGASAVSIEPLVALFSAAADYRPDALSGKAAHMLSELSEYNPMHPTVTLTLRNRIFAFKSLLAANFLMNGVPDDPVWRPLSNGQHPSFPLLVGGGHADVARQLGREQSDLWPEIVEMSKTLGVSERFLASAAVVPIAKYKNERRDWDIITVVDQIAQDSLKNG